MRYGTTNVEIEEIVNCIIPLNFALTFIGITFDILVWYYSKNIDLYGEEEQNKLKNQDKQRKPISPLLTNKKQNSFVAEIITMRYDGIP